VRGERRFLLYSENTNEGSHVGDRAWMGSLCSRTRVRVCTGLVDVASDSVQWRAVLSAW